MGVKVIAMKNISGLNINKIIHIFSIFIVFSTIFCNITFNNVKTTETTSIIALQSMNEYNFEEELVSYINENNDVFNFYTNMFGISLTDLKDSIINDNLNNIIDLNDVKNTGNLDL